LFVKLWLDPNDGEQVLLQILDQRGTNSGIFNENCVAAMMFSFGDNACLKRRVIETPPQHIDLDRN
jgi:hypothetical protein